MIRAGMIFVAGAGIADYARGTSAGADGGASGSMGQVPHRQIGGGWRALPPSFWVLLALASGSLAVPTGFFLRGFLIPPGFLSICLGLQFGGIAVPAGFFLRGGFGEPGFFFGYLLLPQPLRGLGLCTAGGVFGETLSFRLRSDAALLFVGPQALP